MFVSVFILNFPSIKTYFGGLKIFLFGLNYRLDAVIVQVGTENLKETQELVSLSE